MSERLLRQEWLLFQPASPGLRTRAVTLARGLRAAWRRQCSRRRLARLDAHALKDIGITFAEAETEANKPFWRA